MSNTLQGFLPMPVPEGPARPILARPDTMRGAPVVRNSLLDDGFPDGPARGAVKKIVFANPEKGFYVLLVALEDSPHQVAFVGPCEPVVVGDKVEAGGRWEVHAKYGRQLKATSIRVLVPTTGKEIHAFLRNGGIKGIGKATADKLYAHHGDSLSKVMDRPTLLMEARISEKQALLIAESWEKRGSNTELLAFLGSLSLGPAMSDRIIKQYGARAKQKILTNPYDAAKDVSGIGFKTADVMALALGFARDDPRRVNAAILHAFETLARDGHCAASRAAIIRDVRKMLLVDDSTVKQSLESMLQSKDIVEEENGGQPLLFDARVLACEEEIVERLIGMLHKFDAPANFDTLVKEASLAAGIPGLHEHQAQAVRRGIENSLCIITGGPGSRKTSSLEVLLRVYETIHPEGKIALCAPTGRASQRMGEATNRPALTIHRLLGWGRDGEGFEHNAENPLPADLVVADETSMLDIWLMRDILRAMKPGARFIMIGDDDQLASVGPGRVLGDCIDSGIVPVARLTRVFRQGAGSLIAEAARQVNMGKMPKFATPSRSTDFWGAFDENPDECLRKVRRMVTEIAPDMGFDPMRDVQVLVAGHGGTMGTAAINAMLQDSLNPARQGQETFVAQDLQLRAGDRVIQTSNNYDLDVFNGDIGQVVDVVQGRSKRNGARVVVDFEGRIVEYTSMGSIRELSLAYAISVHKSQGSEFPCVIFVCSTQHYVMLRKTLAYTAITRAKKLCVVVGQDRALRVAVRQVDSGRLTGLARRLATAGAEHERRYGDF